jgi:hypothetical protein
MIFADIEVGHASLGFDHLPLKNEWIELNKEGFVVGKQRVTLEEMTVDFSTRHFSHNSAELKDDIVRKMHELEQEHKELKAGKVRYQVLLNKLAGERRNC